MEVRHADMIMTHNTTLTLCHLISIFYSTKRNLLTTFHPAHSLDDAAKFVLLVELQRLVGTNAGTSRHLADIRGRDVLAGWSPAGNDSRDGVHGRALLEVVADNDEAGPQAHFHRNELLKRFVGLRLDFAQPIVSLSDVEGVVVSDSARFLFCHDGTFLVIEEKPLSDYAVISREPCDFYESMRDSQPMGADMQSIAVEEQWQGHDLNAVVTFCGLAAEYF